MAADGPPTWESAAGPTPPRPPAAGWCSPMTRGVPPGKGQRFTGLPRPGPAAAAAPPPCSPAMSAIAVPAYRVRPDGRVQAGHQPPADQEQAAEHRRDRDE